ncbi:hypothetical protein IAR55_005472 [Kwoniella newhampshirensis]|uniref:Uncharacterized protein n=1 Tax=Kwoniella newhampshirensis TaxID=1651941 RepID=A0AAW0YVP7_9TREE
MYQQTHQDTSRSQRQFHPTARSAHAVEPNSSAFLAARPGPESAQDIMSWFSGEDPETLAGVVGNMTIDGRGEEQLERSWRQPRFQAGPIYEKMLARDRMLPPKLGGRSKKDSLGSIDASWGPTPKLTEEERKGMFEILEDPPSRSTSPYKNIVKEELERAKTEAWKRARNGSGNHGSSSNDESELRQVEKATTTSASSRFMPGYEKGESVLERLNDRTVPSFLHSPTQSRSATSCGGSARSRLQIHAAGSDRPFDQPFVRHLCEQPSSVSKLGKSGRLVHS